jgi:hypothetical protein
MNLIYDLDFVALRHPKIAILRTDSTTPCACFHRRLGQNLTGHSEDVSKRAASHANTKQVAGVTERETQLT